MWKKYVMSYIKVEYYLKICGESEENNENFSSRYQAESLRIEFRTKRECQPFDGSFRFLEIVF
jgi:hypothetical protein